MFKEKHLISKEKPGSDDIKLTATGSSITPDRSELVTSEPEKLTDSLGEKRQGQGADLANEMLTDPQAQQIADAIESYTAKDTSGKSIFEKLFGDEGLTLTFNFAHALENHIRTKLAKGFTFIGPNPENDGLTWLWEKDGIEIEVPLPILTEKYEDQAWGDLLSEDAKKQYEKLPSTSIFAERFAEKFLMENLLPFLKIQRPNLTPEQILKSPLAEEIKQKILHGYKIEDPFKIELTDGDFIIRNEKEQKRYDLSDYDDALKPYPDTIESKVDRIIEQSFLNPLRNYLRNKFQILANQFAQDDGDSAPPDLVIAINEKYPEAEITQLIDDIIWDSDLIEDLRTALKAGLESGKPLKISFAGENFTLNNDSQLFDHQMANLHFDLDNDYDENLKRKAINESVMDYVNTPMQTMQNIAAAQEAESKAYALEKFPEESKALNDFFGKYKENPPQTPGEKGQFAKDMLAELNKLASCNEKIAKIHQQTQIMIGKVKEQIDSGVQPDSESLDESPEGQKFSELDAAIIESNDKEAQALLKMYKQYTKFAGEMLTPQ